MQCRFARRLLWGILPCAVLMLSAHAARGQAANNDAGGKKLPVKRVVMFNSGVGFFEHLGEVEGDDEIELRFRVEDVNDLLKSMVVQDLGGGRVSLVSYGSRDPITKTLKTFSIDLTANPTLADLLAQARGEEIEIDAINTVKGTIIGIERRKRPASKESEGVVEIPFVNLFTENGLRSVSLEDATRIEFTNEEINRDLQEALRILAMGHSTDKKTVSLQFLGQGDRQVRIGYIQESPVWKTSYRLVLQEDGSPFLQGWAIVENTTEDDWNNIGLTLVSGRPISFIMDLYSPLYAPRPIEEIELYASLRPQEYGQDLEAREEKFRKLAQRQARGKGATERAAQAPALANAARSRRAAGFVGADKADRAQDMLRRLEESVQSIAQTQDVGEVFQYQISTPVTLKRQRSAMLPIVNESIEGEKVSIYNQGVHEKHPLLGLRMKNTSGLHLMQGPVTVFDEGVYAGDAKIPHLQPGTDRLLSYAMDLDTEVAPTSKGETQQLVDVRLVKGTLYTNRKHRRVHEYVVKNSGRREKRVLIEYRIDSNWKLIQPEKPAEKTRDVYRFAVAAEPGVPAKLEIVEEKTISQSIGLTNVSDSTIRIYINSKVVSDSVKEALQEVIKRKQEISEVVARRQRLERELASITKDQDRVRKNMSELPKDSDLFKRYIKQLDEQEDRVQQLNDEIKQLAEKEGQLRKALDEYLIGLNLE